MNVNSKESSLNFWRLTQSHSFMVPAWWYYAKYDMFMYDIMCYDTVRMNAYGSVIQNAVQGKKVVDVGAGATLPLTLMCVESGAEFVYAIEGNQDAANKAADLVKEKRLTHKVRIIPKYSFKSELTEKADICVSELIGSIGGCEGTVSILKDAKKFLKDDGIMIPQRCVTKIVPISLPDNLYSDEFIEDVVAYYTRSAYDEVGREFEFSRFEFFNFPESNLLAEPQIFEDIHFDKELIPEFARSLSFSISSDGILGGFLLWINLYVNPLTMIDSFKGTCWTPIYIPCNECKPIPLRRQDTMNIDYTVRLSKNGINPDYIFKGVICRDKKDICRFSVHSPYLP